MRGFIICLIFGALVHAIDRSERHKIVGFKDVVRNYKPLIIGNQAKPRIVDGDNAKRKDYPWMASIHLEIEYVDRTGRLYVMVGNKRLDTYERTEQKRYVKEIKMYPTFEAGLLADNAAVLILDECLYMNEYVQRIKMPAPWKDMLLQSRDDCEITGWGTTEEALLSNTLKVVDAPIWGRDECRQFLAGVTPLKTNQLCTKHTDGKGPCVWDYGSPLVCYDSKKEPYVVGMVIAHDIFCTLGFGFHTRVSKFRNWIAKNAED